MKQLHKKGGNCNYLIDLLHTVSLLGLIYNMLQTRNLFIIMAIFLEFRVLFNSS